MSLSAKKYFEILQQVDCGECEFYNPDTGYCEKVCYQRRSYSNVCANFTLCSFSADVYDISEEERTEFNTIYNENA